MERWPKCSRCEFNPAHPGDCSTIRGRILARICRDCGTRYGLYSSKSNRVRCPRCIEKRAKQREAKNPAPPAMPRPMPSLQDILRANLLRYAVSRAINCPGCGDILDVKRAVQYSTKDGREHVHCGLCFDEILSKHPEILTDIIDGRTISGETRSIGGMLG